MSTASSPRIIVALDGMDGAAVRTLAARLDPGLARLKIGKELFTREGPVLVRDLVGRGYDVFLDLKFHDIPNTVAQACRAAAELGVWMLNVHASGGRRMLEAAREGRDASGRRPLLAAVTLLTSLSDAEIHEVGYSGSIADNVARLARLAHGCGLDGVVCSAQEASRLRNDLGKDFVLVTPGIRPAGASADDQQRIVTPEAALRAGAHYLVVGRPITQSDDPRQALLTLNAAIAGIS